MQNRTKLKVRIPPASKTARVSQFGHGEAGVRGGASGDLYVVVHIRRTTSFRRHGDDLLCEVPISFPQRPWARNRSPDSNGAAPPENSPGTTGRHLFRLRGKVCQRARRGHGDQHIRVLVEVPSRLSARNARN